jgi:thiosulfate reductase cytochrome b subunit
MITRMMQNSKFIQLLLAGLLTVLLTLGLATVIQNASARGASTPERAASPLHPDFALLDADGTNVLESGVAISTMQTCGQCHDTGYIVSHSFHADLGLSDYRGSSELNASPGTFGRWDPLTYRYLSQPGDDLIDMTTAEWLMRSGDQIPGGGPATTSREGRPLLSLRPDASDPEASILNPETGQPEGWDWSQSGVIENNCFLCHLEAPNNANRTEAIRSGAFGWANTATLAGTGILSGSGTSYTFSPEAFNELGEVKAEAIALQDPTNENCAQCHGPVHTGDEPFVLQTSLPANETTGQVISAQKISDSGMNVSQKGELARSWDIHAERQLQCVDCHFSLNNPARQQDVSGKNPDHLVYDPRRLDIGEYLEKPNHNFARGQSAQFNVAPELKGTMRRCDSCHDPDKGHADWLPYIDRHMEVLACETCHVPQLYAPAIQTYDWTAITPDGQPQIAYRGVEPGSVEVASLGDAPVTVTNLVTGFKPVLLNRTDADGDSLLSPYNLVTSWYWVYEDSNENLRPVRLVDLEAAWLKDGRYAPEVLSAFDADGDGTLSQAERRIDTPEKESLIAVRLVALGLWNPRIAGQVQPYSINHNVTRGEWGVNDCQSCHSDDSRMTQPVKLADFVPAGVQPEFVSDTNVPATGEMYVDESGALYFQPAPKNEKLYIFGSSRVNWVDWFGGLFFLAVIVGVGGHGTLRYLASRRKPSHTVRTEKVYMYEAYERFWHWLQTVGIVMLLFTGLVIHRPDMFGVFSFRNMVMVHNVLAAILAVNAALSLFYHLTSGQIKQYIPRPRGFFDDAIVQARFYLQGIFKGEAHPFEKKPEKKMNPLQQVTYFGILNVLLPLQGLTGILMWGVQRWPGAADMFGGLPFLAPFHTLIAWTFAAFIVGHVYLTTTGHGPMEGIKGMVTGWEEVEVHELEEEIENTEEPENKVEMNL